MANALIQKLLDAEKEAEVIIRRAKENQAKKHKEAQLSAEEDMVRFRAAEDEKFRREYEERADKSDANADLEEKLRLDVEQVKAQYKKHRDAALALLISGVVKVELNLTEAEKRLVRHQFANKLLK